MKVYVHRVAPGVWGAYEGPDVLATLERDGEAYHLHSYDGDPDVTVAIPFDDAIGLLTWTSRQIARRREIF